MSRKTMKSIWYIVISITLLLCLPGISAALDGPHNETNVVSCYDCHLGGSSAVNPSVTCTSAGNCHTNASGSGYTNRYVAPNVLTHSMVNKGSSTWPVAMGRSGCDPDSTEGVDNCIKCTDCHYFHFFSQHYTYGSATWLVQGQLTGAGASYIDTDGEWKTEFTYSGATGQNSWETRYDEWGEKSGPERGLILLPDNRDVGYGHEIESATSTTIKVKGQLIKSFTPPRNFAIIYGQSINSTDPTWTKSIRFFDKDGVNSFADATNPGVGTGTDSTPDGVCQVCHTGTNDWRSNGSIAANTSDHVNNNGGNCMGCHPHATGFIYNPKDCTGCHGEPPVDDTPGSTGLVYSPIASTGSATAGNHTAHLKTNSTQGCDGCHGANYLEVSQMNSTTPYVTLDFLYGSDGTYNSGSPTYVGQLSVTPGQGGIGYEVLGSTVINPIGQAGNGSLTCSTVYCHSTVQGTSGSGAPATYGTPVWDAAAGTVLCGNCHRDNTETPGPGHTGQIMNSGSHSDHVNSIGSGGYNMSCDTCHTGAGSGTDNHANSVININFIAMPSGSPSYTGDSTNSGIHTPGQGYGDCSNLYCHSNANGTYVAMDWGAGLSLVCDDCHKGPGVSSSALTTTANNARGWSIGAMSSPHGIHAGTDTYNNPNRVANSDGINCATCHNNTTTDNATVDKAVHVDGALVVEFSSQGIVGGGAGGSNCSAVFCHTDGVRGGAGAAVTAPDWGTVAGGACGDCHGADDGTPPVSGAHAKHVGDTSVYLFECNKCHEVTVDNTQTSSATPPGIADYDIHVDGVQDVDFNEADAKVKHPSESVNLPGYAANASPDLATCSNIYCHSLGDISVGAADPTQLQGTPTGSQLDLPTAYPTGIYSSVNWGDSLGCDGCHGKSRTTAADGMPDYNNPASSPEGDEAANSHYKHVIELTQGCEACHWSTTNDGSTIISSSAHVNGINTDVVPNPANTFAYNAAVGTKTCSSFASGCHGVGPSPKWGGTASCDTCHPAATGTVLGADLSSAHVKHYDTDTPAGSRTAIRVTADETTANYVFNCGFCHNTVDNVDHNDIDSIPSPPGGPLGDDGYYVNIVFNVFSSPVAGYTAGTLSATGNSQSGPGGGFNYWTNGTCSNIYCHSNANAAADWKVDVTWNQGSLACNACHRAAAGYTAMTTAPGASTEAGLMSTPHPTHVATDKYGDAARANPVDCGYCHSVTATDGGTLNDRRQHVDMDAKDVAFSSWPGGSWSADQCSNTYCHSEGTSTTGFHAGLSWAGNMNGECTNCHGGNASATLLKGQITTNAHNGHINNTSGVGRTIGCSECHNATASADTTLAGYVYHVNKLLNIKFSGSWLGAETPTYNSQSAITASGATKTPGDTTPGSFDCASVYCHSDGNINRNGVAYNTVAWDAGTTFDCTTTTCHGDGTNVHNATDVDGGTKDTASNNSHAKHIGQGYNCTHCHESTTSDPNVPPATVIADVYHLDRTETVSLKTINSLSGTYDDAGNRACSNTYCHGTSASPYWGNIGSTNCSTCHQSQGAGGAASYAPNHQTHVEASGYNFSCEMCHNATNGTVISHSGGPASGNNPGGDPIGANQTTEIQFNADGTGAFVSGEQYLTSTTTYRRRSLANNPYDAESAITPTYTDGASFTSDLQAPGITYTTNGTCNTIWCHSDAKPLGAPSTTFAPVAWDATLDCGSCHNANGGSAAHAKHITTYAANTNFRCDACHRTTAHDTDNALLDPTTGKTWHVNYEKNVVFNTWADPASTANYFSPNCQNTYCHSDGTSATTPSHGNVTWADTGNISCTSCHGGQDSLTNSHPVHTGTAAPATQFGYTCDNCHVETVNSGISTISSVTLHVNKVKNVAVSIANGGTGTDGGDFSGGVCSTTYCHGSASQESWATGATTYATGDCSFCHGMSNDVTDDRDTAGLTDPAAMPLGAHQVHLYANTLNDNAYQYRATAVACNDCHVDPKDTGGSYVNQVKNTANHMNGTAEVPFPAGSFALTGGLTPDYDTTVVNGCDSVYCHNPVAGGVLAAGNEGSGIQPVWNNTAYLSAAGKNQANCDRCHASPDGAKQISASYNHSSLDVDTDPCSGCHSHDGDSTDDGIPGHQHIDGSVYGQGESTGGADCEGCHTDYFNTTADTGSEYTMHSSVDGVSYKHYMNNASAATPYPSAAPGGAADGNRRCTMCHVDHDIFRPDINVANGSRAANLRASISVSPSASNPSTFANTDFDETQAQGGICLSCHYNAITSKAVATPNGEPNVQAIPFVTGDVAQAKAVVANSTHSYAVPSEQFTTTGDNSSFQAICSKCHNDTIGANYGPKSGVTGQNGSTGNPQFGMHISNVNSSFAVMGAQGFGEFAELTATNVLVDTAFACPNNSKTGGDAVVVSGAGWTEDQWLHYDVVLIAGGGANQRGTIVCNTTDTIYFDSTEDLYASVPSTLPKFQIVREITSIDDTCFNCHSTGKKATPGLDWYGVQPNGRDMKSKIENMEAVFVGDDGSTTGFNATSVDLTTNKLWQAGELAGYKFTCNGVFTELQTNNLSTGSGPFTTNVTFPERTRCPQSNWQIFKPAFHQLDRYGRHSPSERINPTPGQWNWGDGGTDTLRDSTTTYGSCSNASYTNEGDCVSNSAIWTYTSTNSITDSSKEWNSGQWTSGNPENPGTNRFLVTFPRIMETREITANGTSNFTFGGAGFGVRPGEAYYIGPNVAGGEGRHVSCADCHNTHASTHNPEGEVTTAPGGTVSGFGTLTSSQIQANDAINPLHWVNNQWAHYLVRVREFVSNGGTPNDPTDDIYGKEQVRQVSAFDATYGVFTVSIPFDGVAQSFWNIKATDAYEVLMDTKWATCSNPQYLTQSTCQSGGGTWVKGQDGGRAGSGSTGAWGVQIDFAALEAADGSYAKDSGTFVNMDPGASPPSNFYTKIENVFDRTTLRGGTTTASQADLCVRCHGWYAFGDKPGSVVSGHADGSGVKGTDVAAEFNPSNTAHHAVYARGNNQPLVDSQVMDYPWSWKGTYRGWFRGSGGSAGVYVATCSDVSGLALNDIVMIPTAGWQAAITGIGGTNLVPGVNCSGIETGVKTELKFSKNEVDITGVTAGDEMLVAAIPRSFNMNWPRWKSGINTISGNQVTFDSAMPSNVLPGWFYIDEDANAGQWTIREIVSVDGPTQVTLKSAPAGSGTSNAQITAGLGNAFVPPMGPWTVLRCTDCHGSTKTDPVGPHASVNKWLIKSIDKDLEFQWFNGTSVVPVNPGNNLVPALDGSKKLNYFCFNCHRRDVYGDNAVLTTPTGAASKMTRLPHGLNMDADGNILDASRTLWPQHCRMCHGGDKMGAIHGGNAPNAVRFLNGSSWGGPSAKVGFATTSAAVTCYVANADAKVSTCSAHSGGATGDAKATYDYTSY